MKINVGGRAVEAERMQFQATEEPWAQYRLEDGSTVKLKLVVSDVFKLTEADSVTGLPQYVVRSSNVMSVEPPQSKGSLN